MHPARFASLRQALHATCRLVRASSLPASAKPRSSAAKGGVIEAPVAEKEACERRAYGIGWEDPFAWMENLEDPRMLAHLQRENRYVEAAMADTRKLQRNLLQEMKARMATMDGTPPEVWGDWYYYIYNPEGGECPAFYRSRRFVPEPVNGVDERSTDANHTKGSGGWWKRLQSTLNRLCYCGVNESTQPAVEVVFEPAELAELYGQFRIGMLRISSDHRWVALTIDSSGQEKYMLVLKDLQSGDIQMQHCIPGVFSVEWAADGRTFFYTELNNLPRPYRVRRRTVEAGEGEEDEVVLECEDPGKYIDISRTKDWHFLTLSVKSKTSTEVFLVNAREPSEPPRLVEPRMPHVQYFVEHHRDHFYIITNGAEGSKGEYQLVRTPEDKPGRSNWQPVLDSEGAYFVALEDMEVFESHAVLFRRRKGLPEIAILDLPLEEFSIPLPPSKLRTVSLPQTVCYIVMGINKDFNSKHLRFSLSSPKMPYASFDLHLPTGQLTLLSQQSLLSIPEQLRNALRIINGAGEAALAVKPLVVDEGPKAQGESGDKEKSLVGLIDEISCERVEVDSHDGVRVPLTIVRLQGLPQDGLGPALVEGYGAYGQCFPTEWCPNRLSLLQRGWTLAFAHTRGGGELGRAWYASGRLQQKENSFKDFLSCAHLLLEEGYAARGRLAGKGTSAGGLLLAGVANMEPELFRALVLNVPFLDVCSSMLNEELPLTAHDYEEWGNPAQEGVLQRLFGYSPYANIQAGRKYPAVFLTAALNDTRVGCWEAAKWAARLRDVTECGEGREVLLRTSFDCGHRGAVGIDRRLEESALEYAFLLKYNGGEGPRTP